MGRELLIKSTISTSLKWDDNSERAIDRVTAIGLSSKHNKLGSELLRVEALDQASMRSVILLITRKINHKHRITRGISQKIAIAVLHEHLQPYCPTCSGKGEIHNTDELTITCFVCNGTGKHRFTDTERTRLVGGTYNKQAYDYALGCIRDSIVDIVRTTNWMLE